MDKLYAIFLRVESIFCPNSNILWIQALSLVDSWPPIISCKRIYQKLLSICFLNLVYCSSWKKHKQTQCCKGWDLLIFLPEVAVPLNANNAFRVSCNHIFFYHYLVKENFKTLQIFQFSMVDLFTWSHFGIVVFAWENPSLWRI